MSFALVLGALLGAVLLAPIGSQDSGESADPIQTIAPSRLTRGDERLLAVGKSDPRVGEQTPEVAFITYEGTSIELHQRTRPVVLGFLGGTCTDCEAEVSKLAVVSVTSSQEVFVAALAEPAAGDDVRDAYEAAGAVDLVYAGIDEGGGIAGAFGIDTTPATVVLDGSARIAAVWRRSIPTSVLNELLRTLVDGA